MEFAAARTDSLSDRCVECRTQPSETNRVFCSECRERGVLCLLEGLLYQYAKGDNGWLTIYLKVSESIALLPSTLQNKIAELRELHLMRDESVKG